MDTKQELIFLIEQIDSEREWILKYILDVGKYLVEKNANERKEE